MGVKSRGFKTHSELKRKEMKEGLKWPKTAIRLVREVVTLTVCARAELGSPKEVTVATLVVKEPPKDTV